MIGFGTPILAVEAGTEIRDEVTGDVAVVDDEHAVMKAGRIYVTKSCFDLILAHPAVSTLQ